jgi:hypothetical protein
MSRPLPQNMKVDRHRRAGFSGLNLQIGPPSCERRLLGCQWLMACVSTKADRKLV